MTFVEDARKILGEFGSNVQNLHLLFACREKLVPFVGAGLSLEFGYPTWNTLLEDLAVQADLKNEVESLLSERKFEEAAEMVAEALPAAFNDTIQLTFDHTKLARPINKGAVRYVPLIASGLVLTTNFDRVLETTFKDAGKEFRDIFHGSRIREASQAIQLNEPILLKLHGDYRDSENRILTLSQYKHVYGSSNADEADLKGNLPHVLGQALAAAPFLFLGCSLKIDRTITVIGRLAKESPGTRHFALLPDSEEVAKRRQQLDHWNIRPLFYPKGRYEKIQEFLACLAHHWNANHGSDLPISANKRGTRAYLEVISKMAKQGETEQLARTTNTATSGTSTDEIVRINGLKLFYFRSMKKFSFAELSKVSGVDKEVLRKIEKVDTKPGLLGPHCFQRCGKTVIGSLERALDCVGELEGDKPDDFLSHYLQFYFCYKRVNTFSAQVGDQLDPGFPTKIVVFDFDGTLTERSEDMTTWEKIWISLGYHINDSAELQRRFRTKEFSHKVWCDITRDKFREKRFRHDQLRRIAKTTSLISGTRETIEYLKKNGLKLYILSGSIKEIIRICLGRLCDYFEEIRANEIVFDQSGVISQINGTPFDFEHKATFLKRVYEDNQLSPMNVLFIGNSCNDVWASQSGVRTLCVNPHFTNPDDTLQWTYAIRKMKDLKEVLNYVQLESVKHNVRPS